MELTKQQQRATRHEWGTHAKIVGVPGCGKTYTLLRLVAGLKINPRSVLVLMYNRRAKEDFERRLKDLLPPGRRPSVHTVHSYCFSVMNWTQKNLGIDMPELWTEEQSLYHINVAINQLRRDGAIEKWQAETIDNDSVMSAIDMYKSMGVTSADAGHTFDDMVPAIYERFEELRRKLGAITFSDFAPRVNHIARVSQEVAKKMRYRLVIVDEAQDLDYSQWQLVRFIVEQGADLVVAGDADQTLYEWRGARPEWLMNVDEMFTDKPVDVYPLTYNFRSGAAICQVANNIIGINKHREGNVLVSSDPKQWGEVEVVSGQESNYVLAKWIRDQVLRGTHPSQVRVLARTYAQMNGIEAALLSLKVPYKVKGNDGFLTRSENTKLLEYVSLAQRLDEQIDDEAIEEFVGIMNSPNRMIPKATVKRLLSVSQTCGMTVMDALMSLEGSNEFFPNVQYNIGNLVSLLHNISLNLSESAGVMLQRIVDSTEYYSHFKKYYGGQKGDDKIRSVRGFLDYAKSTGMNVVVFKEHLTSVDTTQGVEDESQLIILTTVFQEKGCEYLYVVIPDCIEGTMPVTLDGSLALGCYDKRGIVPDPHSTDKIESERRLFYVAITRARTKVMIGTRNTGRDKPSRFIEEARVEHTQDLMGEVQRLKSGVGKLEDVLIAYGRLRTDWAWNSLRLYLDDEQMKSVPKPTKVGFVSSHRERVVTRPDREFDLDAAWRQLVLLAPDERGV